MVRFAVLAAFALALLAPTRAGAQPLPGTFQVVDAKINDGRFVWTATEVVPVTKQIEVQVVVNGMAMIQKVTVTELQSVMVEKAADLKTLTATDGAGKALDAEKLADLLKKPMPVVLVAGPVAEKHRKLFKENTVFVEMSPPKLLPPPLAKQPELIPPPKM